MTIVDANGHGLSGSDEEKLPNMGAAVKEAEAENDAIPEDRGPKEGMQDARLLTTAECIENFNMVLNNIFIMSIELNQREAMAMQQKQILDPALTEMKGQMTNLQQSRNVLRGIINDRFHEMDLAWWKKRGIDIHKERPEPEPDPTPKGETNGG